MLTRNGCHTLRLTAGGKPSQSFLSFKECENISFEGLGVLL